MKITSIIFAALFVSGIAMAKTFAPEEDITYSVSTDDYIIVANAAIADQDAPLLRFAPEEDITYSVSTDNVAPLVDCEKRK